MSEHDEPEVDLAAALGASVATSTQILTLYVPNKDRDGREFGTQRRWVLEAASLLAEMGGGVTVMPPCEGGWWNEGTRTLVWEAPVVVYTYIKPDAFVRELPRLRALLHRLGRETNQGEVGVEFDGRFYRINTFESGGP
ncbi:MAG: hypothetical protein HY909_31355 [Deltaproteobacteria bacterium]|nr:hypothetical protein [Deltaproteobacteria bacterium]